MLIYSWGQDPATLLETRTHRMGTRPIRKLHTQRSLAQSAGLRCLPYLSSISDESRVYYMLCLAVAARLCMELHRVIPDPCQSQKLREHGLDNDVTSPLLPARLFAVKTMLPWVRRPARPKVIHNSNARYTTPPQQLHEVNNPLFLRLRALGILKQIRRRLA
jgi:hypothetical protein